MSCEHKFLPVVAPTINLPWNPLDFKCTICKDIRHWDIEEEKRELWKFYRRKNAKQILEGYIQAAKTYQSKNFNAEQDKELVEYATDLLTGVK